MSTQEGSRIFLQEDFSSSQWGKYESLFTLGNGYLGLRGDMEIPGMVDQRGSYINGFYEKGRIIYGERAFGYAENWQTMVALPEGKEFRWTIDGATLDRDSLLKEQRRYLDLRKGMVQWEFTWKHPRGYKVKCRITRLVPFSLQGSALIHWEWETPEENVEVALESALMISYSSPEGGDPRLPEHFTGESLRLTETFTEEKISGLILETKGAGLGLAALADFESSGLDWDTPEPETTFQGLHWKMKGTNVSKKFSTTKFLSYQYGTFNRLNEVRTFAKEELLSLKDQRVSQWIKNQESVLKDFWNTASVEIKGVPGAQESLGFNLFHLFQSTGRDGRRSIAAKGLSGPGYEGHYFWDAETYVLPFFIFTFPDIAHSMLMYRVSTLNKARERARLLGHPGALFPWRTINGEEASAFFPAGTAQYHINADIALGLCRYLKATGDLTLLDQGGGELLMETARFWVHLGCWIEGKGFCFHEVTGPDEYTAMVDNNFYTNLMARENLREAHYWLSNREKLMNAIGLSKEELAEWKRVEEGIYLPYGEMVTPQDDSFLTKGRWDFYGTPRDHYPLLLNYHPLSIYRKQVLKQADVVMAMVQLPKEVPPARYKGNFDYYEELTTRDSSLSACAQGIASTRIGYEDLAWEYFNETLYTDSKDLHGNVAHGLHTASMGGSYLMVLSGFLGFDFIGGIASFKPKLSPFIKSITLRICLQREILKIDLNQMQIMFSLESEGPLEIFLFSRRISLVAMEAQVFPCHPSLSAVIEIVKDKDLSIGKAIEGELPCHFIDPLGIKGDLEEGIYNLTRSVGLVPEEVLLVTDNKEYERQLQKGWTVLYSPEINLTQRNLSVYLAEQFTQLQSRGLRFMGKRPKTRPFNGILMDLDGVITDTGVFHNKAWERISRELGMEFPQELGEALRGIGRKESFMLILKRNNRQMSEEEIEKWISIKNEYYRESLRTDLDEKHILPGVKDILSGLKDLGIPCVLVSASRNAPFILEKLKLTSYFSDLVDPVAVQRGKPNPDIFLKGCELLKLKPHEVVGIEDAEAGVEGMLAAGMYTIGVGNLPGLESAHRVLPDLRDFKRVLELFMG